jgi:uncharacterized repeat protein (TIGR03803 family)
MRSKKPFSAGKPTFVIFIAILLASAIVPTQAQARKFKVLHTFHGRDGAEPVGVLVRDAVGNIYGTTGVGGTGTKCPNFSNFGCGTAFKMNKAGKEVWLHSFNGGDGAGPLAGLLRDAAGNLYGTTVAGGKATQACGGVQLGGCGLVFKLDKAGKETVLHKFKGTPDGFFPESLLVKDPAGNLYGTTYLGGPNVLGTVFKINTNRKETILHSFPGPPNGGGDGAFSYEGVIRDTTGNLYGVTAAGGAFGAGAVYKVDTSGKESLLHSFSGGDGAQPDSVLLLDPSGNLYGTTANGGNSECGGTGCGVVFELSPQSGGNWVETVLYAFCSLSNCADGEGPGGLLVRDSTGNLYGTTIFGGTSTRCNGTCGVVFKLDTTGKETVLHSFTGGADGAIPESGLALDDAGNLYGSTNLGGDRNCQPKFGGCGVVFRIAP